MEASTKSRSAAAERERITIRMPATLRDKLATEAQREDVTMNALIVAILAGGVGWRPRAGRRAMEWRAILAEPRKRD